MVVGAKKGGNNKNKVKGKSELGNFSFPPPFLAPKWAKETFFFSVKVCEKGKLIFVCVGSTVGAVEEEVFGLSFASTSGLWQ